MAPAMEEVLIFLVTSAPPPFMRAVSLWEPCHVKSSFYFSLFSLDSSVLTPNEVLNPGSSLCIRVQLLHRSGFQLDIVKK